MKNPDTDNAGQAAGEESATPEPSSMFKSLFGEMESTPSTEPVKHGFETASQIFSDISDEGVVDNDKSDDKSETSDDKSDDKSETSDDKSDDKPETSDDKSDDKAEAPSTPIQFSRKKVEKPDPEPEAKEADPPKPEATDPGDVEFEATLSPAEKEHFDIMKFAATKIGGEFEGADKKFADFVKAHRKFVTEALEGDPDVVFDQDNEDYQKFLRTHQPVLSKAQFKRIEKEQLKEEVRAEMRGDFESTNRKLSELEVRPVAQKRLDDFYSLMDQVIPENIRESLKEGGDEKAEADFPIEHPIVADLIPRYTEMGKAFIEVDSGLVKFDPKNPSHGEMRKFLDIQIEHVKNSKYALRDGKQFISPEEFSKLPKEGRTDSSSSTVFGTSTVGDKHWTLSRVDQIAVFKYGAEADIKAIVDREYARLEKAGFVRQQKAPVTPPPERQSIRSKPSVAPGSATPVEGKEVRSPYARALLDE